MFSYQQALQDLNSQIELPDNKTHWNLDNIKTVISSFNNSRLFTSVQIVGTNGKGTTAHFISQILSSHRRKTGLFTSPHLIDICERISINNQPISETRFSAIYYELMPIFQKFQLSFFEKLTLLAFVYFTREKVEYVIWETGLGGRLDAVTVIGHELLLVTAIGIDHTEYLGNTLAKIAQEKIAALKNSAKAYSLKQKQEVTSILENTANDLKKPLRFVCLHSHKLQQRGTDFVANNCNYHIPMWGKHYCQNALLALSACQDLLAGHFNKQTTKHALANTFIPGRLQMLKSKTLPILLSTAHNFQALTADIETILWLMKKQILTTNIHVLFATSRNRPADQFCQMLLTHFNTITVTQIPPYSKPYLLLQKSDLAVNFIEDYQKAFVQVFSDDNCDLVLVVGSIYLCGLAIKYLDM